MVFAIRIKQSSQRKGPGVEPWPGPKRGTSADELYFILEVPYFVLIW